MGAIDAKAPRRSYVSGSVGRLFAWPIAKWFGVGERRSRLTKILSQPAFSIADGLTDATAKLIAWLMAMAILVLMGTASITIMAMGSEPVARIVERAVEAPIPFAALMSAVQGIRIGVLWREPDWLVDRQTGFKGWLQNPGDLDVIVGGALWLALMCARGMS